MQESVIVSVDAMGGDNAPGEIVKGAVEAVQERSNLLIKLVGKEDVIQTELKRYSFPDNSIEIVPASDIITNDEAPVMAIRRKKDSSVVVGLNLLKEKKADAFISAGSTGAVLVGAQLIVGRVQGVERPPLAPLIPTSSGVSLLVDCGANVDARPSHLVQFAKLGSIYMQYVLGVVNPRVAIVNIGAEEEKGNLLVKETYPLLKNCNDINFTGSIEARDIPFGAADVIVCEAFVGNVILKLYEGLGSMLIKKVKEGLTSTKISTIGAAISKPALKRSMKQFDVKEYGGAPMLGLNALVVKTHGSSKSVEIKNSILQCITFQEQNINNIIKEKLVKDPE